MRKVDDREKKTRRRKKIMSFIVATNVVASQPPECRPTETAHACAKNSQHMFFGLWRVWWVAGGSWVVNGW